MISYIDNTKNVVTEVPITIAASSWSSSAPYTYTWSDARILAGSSVEVDVLNTTADTSVISLDYEKSVGSITFTASSQPTTSISVNICIINARADIGSAINANSVSTSAITGAANVEEALTLVSNYEIPTNYAFASVSELSARLTTALNGMNANDLKLLRLSCTGSFDCFYSGVSYFIELKKSSANYASCTIQGVGFDSTIIGTMASATWSFSSITEKLNTRYASNTYTASAGVSVRNFYVEKIGKLCSLTIQFDVTSAKSNGDVLITNIPASFRPSGFRYFAALGSVGHVPLSLSSEGKIIAGSVGIPVQTWISVTCTYIVDSFG